MEIENSTLFFLGFGFGFGFSGGMVRELEELGVCILSCLGVDFVLAGSDYEGFPSA